MNDAANKNSPALITKWNKPRVTIVIGKVRINSTGRTNTLSTPSTSAAINAAYRSTTSIPEISAAAIKTANAPRSKREIICIMHVWYRIIINQSKIRIIYDTNFVLLESKLTNTHSTFLYLREYAKTYLNLFVTPTTMQLVSSHYILSIVQLFCISFLSLLFRL